MDPLLSFYHGHIGLSHLVIAALVFGGMGRIAFWRNSDGLRVGGMLATGLALLLTVALLSWATENVRRISEIGPWAVFAMLMAIVILIRNTWLKSRDM